MTEYNDLIQELRIKAEFFERVGDVYAATKMSRAADAIQELVNLHQLDMSEISTLRRQVQAVVEGKA